MKRMIAVVVPLTLLVLATGCGDDDTSASGTTDATDATAPPSAADTDDAAVEPSFSGEPIVIGMTSAEFGSGFELVGPAEGLEAWAAQLNADGGIFGREVVIDRCNDEATAEGALACAQGHLDDANVVIASGMSPLSGAVTATTYAEGGAPYVPAFPIDAGDFSAPAAIATPGTLTSFPALTQYLVEEEQLTRVAMIRLDVAATEFPLGLVQIAAASAGGEFVADITVAADTADFLPAVLEAVEADADVVMLGVLPQQLPRIIEAVALGGEGLVLAGPGSSVTAEDMDVARQQRRQVDREHRLPRHPR